MGSVRIKISNDLRGNPPYIYYLFLKPVNLLEEDWLQQTNLSHLPINPTNINGYITNSNITSQDIWIFDKLKEGIYYIGVKDNINNWKLNRAEVYEELRFDKINKTDINNNNPSSIEIHIKGGKPKFLYELITSDGNSIFSGWIDNRSWIFNNLPKDNYKIQIKDDLNNQINNEIIINNLNDNELKLLEFNINKPISIKGLNDGELKLLVSKGISPIEAKLFKINNNDFIEIEKRYIAPDISEIFDKLEYGYYYIEINDTNTNIRTNTILLLEGREPLIATINSQNLSNPVINDGKISITPINGSSPYTSKLINGPNGLTYPLTSNNLEFNNLIPGTYRVELIDAYNMSYFDDITIQDYILSPININFIIQNPSSYNDVGKIIINSISGGYKPELFGLDKKENNQWINYIDFSNTKTFLVNSGVYRIKIKELPPLTNITYSNDIIITSPPINPFNIFNLLVTNTSSKNKNDGKIYYEIINGIGSFESKLSIITQYPNQNYNNILQNQINERTFEWNNLPIGDYLLNIKDTKTLHEINQNISITFNQINTNSVAVILGSTDVKSNYNKGTIFVNTPKSSAPYEWNILTNGVLLNDKKGITDGSHVFKNLDLNREYNIVLKDGAGNVSSFFWNLPTHNNTLFIKSIDNGISTNFIDTTVNIKINIEGVNPPFIYRAYTTDNVLLEETLPIPDLEYTFNINPNQYIFEIQDNNFNIVRRYGQGYILSNVNYNNDYYISNVIKTDQTIPLTKNGSIKIEVSGGNSPYTGYLINEFGELINTLPNYPNPQTITNNTFFWGELNPSNYIFYSLDNSSLNENYNNQLIFEEITINSYNIPDLVLIVGTIDPISTNDGSISVDISGGIGPIYEINLYDSNLNLIQNTRTQFLPVFFNNLKAGDYKIIVKDFQDTSITKEEFITLNASLQITWSRIKNTIITNILPPPNGLAPFIYELYQGVNLINTSGSINTRSFTFNNISPGTYKVKVTDNNLKIKETDDIIIYSPLILNYTKVDSNSANGNGIITTIANGGDGNYKYTNLNNNQSNNNGIFNNLKGGSYNILVEDTSGEKSNIIVDILNLEITCDINDPNCLGMEFNGLVTPSQNIPNIHTYNIGNREGYFTFEFIGNKMPFKIKVKYPTDTNFILETDFIENIGMYGFYHNGSVSTIEFHVVGYTDLAIKNPSNGENFNYTIKVNCPDNTIKDLPKINLFSVSNNNLPINSQSCNGTIAYSILGGIPPFQVLLYETKDLILDGVNYEGEQWFITKSFESNNNPVFKIYHYDAPDSNKIYYINGLCGWTKKDIIQNDNTLNPDIRSGYTLVIKNMCENPNQGCLIKYIPSLNEAIPITSTGFSQPSTISNINNQLQPKGSLFNFYKDINLFNNGPLINFNIGNEPSCDGCSNGAIQINIFNFPFNTSLLKVLNSNKQPATNILGQLGDNTHYLFILDSIDDKPFIYYVVYNGIETKIEGKLDKSEKIKCYTPEILIRPTDMNLNSGVIKLTLNRFSTQFGDYEFSLTNNNDYTQSTIINHNDNTLDKIYNFTGVKSGYYNYKIMNILDNSIQCSGNIAI